MNKLINCGCGGFADSHLGKYEKWFISCEKCGVRTPLCASRDEAIEIWNKAMGAKDINVLDKETVLIESFDANLTHVGYCICGELVNIDYSYCPRCGRKIEWRRMTL